ncbi:AAA family ATPase [Carnobacterium sp. TMP28]|uniref:AAA family ATPase n=1 Tax=Carnobacterium sp. TMP28 TaxID=3397060 RepID=UPI0039E01B1C
MKVITVQLFGNFRTTIDGEAVLFPYGKIQALFSYLVVNKRATRDELSLLLWANMEDRIAKKNLRNALYTLKKLFHAYDLLVYDGLSSVSIQTDAQLVCDYDSFIKNPDDCATYGGEFLKGCSVKGAENFDVWIDQLREETKSIYLERVRFNRQKSKESKDYEELEMYCKLTIKADEFDEEAYNELMVCYKDQQKYSSAIQIYNELADFLSKELSIVPDEEAESIYLDVLDLMNQREEKVSSERFFFGRESEVRLLQKNYHQFIEKNIQHSFLIRGEMGVGKTRLKDYFLKDNTNQDSRIVEVSCYQFERDYSLKSWKTAILDIVRVAYEEKITVPLFLMNALSEFIPDVRGEWMVDQTNKKTSQSYQKLFGFEETITEIIKYVTAKKKMIVVFEDIHWMDAASLALLTSLLINNDLPSCLFIVLSRNEKNADLEKFIINTNYHPNMHHIQLSSFTKDENKRFINRTLPDNQFTEKLHEKIYTETNGNAFFLTEYLQLVANHEDPDEMSAKMIDVLQKRFLDMTENEKRIVEVSSLFYDEVPLRMLKEFIQLDELEIIYQTENLVKKRLLVETTTGKEISYAFNHQKLRDFVYTSLSPAKKTILHNRVGKRYEKELKNNLSDLTIYFKLIYHFEKAENHMDTLYYQVKRMDMLLNFVHERFPVIHYDEDYFRKLYINEADVDRMLGELRDRLVLVKKEEIFSKEIALLEADILFLCSRNLIRKGDYSKGLRDIQQLLNLAEKYDMKKYLLGGYEQMMCYCIQTENAEIMAIYLKKMDEILKNEFKEEQGLIYRYQGLYNMLIKNYKHAEKYLQDGISYFIQTEERFEKYCLIIAACYNNIGDSKVILGEHEEAIRYYKKAIHLCEEKKSWISISLFETNLGIVLFEMGQYKQAKVFLKRAMKTYEKIEYNMSQSMAEVYMSYIMIEERNYSKALDYIKDASKHAKVLNVPKEKVSINEWKEKINLLSQKDKKVAQAFERYLKRHPINTDYKQTSHVN